MVLLATAHYFQVQKSIERDVFEPEKRWILVCSLVVLFIGTGVVYYVLSAPTAPVTSVTAEHD